MSNPALLTRPRPNHLRAVPRPDEIAGTVPRRPVAEPPAPRSAAPSAPATGGSSPRGFALYVGVDEQKASAAGVSLSVLVDTLRRTVAELSPDAETYAAVALAPHGAGGRDVDVVRLALHEPAATAHADPEPEDQGLATGVVVDISRKRIELDGVTASLTFKEFELLQYLVLREGRTIERSQLVSALWPAVQDGTAPGERTIDVHIRRLRAKLGRYEDIVRTVRGIGYRFDRHADVVIRYGYGSPSPDRI